MNILDNTTLHYFREVLGVLSINEITQNRELINKAIIVQNLLSQTNSQGRITCNLLSMK